MPEKHFTSARAKRVWDRLQNWYGDSLDQYGLAPPRDWCAAIDAMGSEVIEERVMAEIRVEHPVYPPRFPQFDALVAKHCGERGTAPSVAARLIDYVLKHKETTRWQRGMPWTLVGRVMGNGIEITGVSVPACPQTGAQGYWVSERDLILDQVE
jgi:hypothetical protein